jgi:hypothetical protein
VDQVVVATGKTGGVKAHHRFCMETEFHHTTSDMLRVMPRVRIGEDKDIT